MTENSTSKRKNQSKESIEKLRREKTQRNNRIIFFCIVAFFVGYYILNYVSTLERPPIGVTFNIVLGCTIIAVSIIILFYIIKKQYFPKKRKRTKHVFLEELLDENTEPKEVNS